MIPLDNKKDGINPIDALNYAILNGLMVGERPEPGYFIQKLDSEKREALKKLTSDMALNIRPDLIH